MPAEPTTRAIPMPWPVLWQAGRLLAPLAHAGDTIYGAPVHHPAVIGRDELRKPVFDPSAHCQAHRAPDRKASGIHAVSPQPPCLEAARADECKRLVTEIDCAFVPLRARLSQQLGNSCLDELRSGKPPLARECTRLTEQADPRQTPLLFCTHVRWSQEVRGRRRSGLSDPPSHRMFCSGPRFSSRYLRRSQKTGA